MAILLNGPSLAPLSGQAPDSAIVLLHGYGSNGDDLIGLAPHWRKLLPNTLFIAPNAPQPTALAPGGRQWWDLSRMDAEAIQQGVDSARPVLDTFLDDLLSHYALPASRLSLVGFSQGAVLALHAGLRREAGPAAILGYSGRLAAPERLKRDMRCAPPILLVHGEQDDVLPVSGMLAAAAALSDAGLGVQWRICPGLGHSIDKEGLEAGGAFLAKALAVRSI